MSLKELIYQIRGAIYTVFKKLGLLVNFNVSKLVDSESLLRIIN